LAVQTASQHRRQYRKSLGDRVVVLKGATAIRRNGDVDFTLRQHSEVLYLSACDLPDVFIILTQTREILCIPKVDENHLVWLGKVPSAEETQVTFGFEEAQYNEGFDELIKSLSSTASSLTVSSDLREKIQKLCPDTPLREWRKDIELQSLRVLKSPHEITLMQEVALASSRAHITTMEQVKAGMMEWQVQDCFLTALRSQGVRELSFPTIAACGSNGSVLHYTRDMSKLQKGQLCLLDAGGEWLGYAGDITRTWPVGSAFSELQKELYSIVLNAKHQATAMAKKGLWLSDLQACVMRELTLGCREFGLLHGRVEDLLENEAVRLFYPHGCSHQLGLDVHDVSPRQTNPSPVPYAKVRADQQLEENMVITMEPGLYFIEALVHSAEKREKLDKWVNWSKAESLLGFGGIRIEDDLWIRANNCQSLSCVPELVSDIEAIRQKANLVQI
jgi:Xaa-Pro dipeptidase